MTIYNDRYASLIFTNRSPESLESKSVKRKNHQHYENGNKVKYSLWSNIDFQKLQKFVFISILRTHFSLKQKNIKLLAEKHLKRMIEIYFDNNIFNDVSYPILIGKLDDVDDKKVTILLPINLKNVGHHRIDFLGGGYYFIVYVSSHRKPEEIYDLRLKKDGSIYITNHLFLEIGFLRDSYKRMREIK